MGVDLGRPGDRTTDISTFKEAMLKSTSKTRNATDSTYIKPSMSFHVSLEDEEAKAAVSLRETELMWDLKPRQEEQEDLGTNRGLG